MVPNFFPSLKEELVIYRLKETEMEKGFASRTIMIKLIILA